jgi:hypothetical protein
MNARSFVVPVFRGALHARAVFALILGCLPVLAFSQTALTGVVTNTATGRALEGARVTLENTGREVLTDSQGNYRFDNVAPGSVTLSVSYTGLDQSTAPVTVAAGTVNRHDVGLTSQIYAMSTFVVAGEREGNAQAVTLQRLASKATRSMARFATSGFAG